MRHYYADHKVVVSVVHISGLVNLQLQLERAFFQRHSDRSRYIVIFVRFFLRRGVADLNVDILWLGYRGSRSKRFHALTML